MRTKTILFVLTLAVLAGCNKNTSTAESEAPLREVPLAQPAPAADERPTIAVLGDSLSEGAGVDPEESFPSVLQRKLEKEGYLYHVVNLGVSGDTTAGGLGRLDYTLSLKPSITVLELGGNDGLRGVSVGSTKANLASMIKRSQAAGSKVLLAGMTLPPNYGSDYIRQFEDVYKDLAKEYNVPLLPFLMEDIRTKIKGGASGLMQRDGIHPTAAGHLLVADTVFQSLKPLLEKQ